MTDEPNAPVLAFRSADRRMMAWFRDEAHARSTNEPTEGVMGSISSSGKSAGSRTHAACFEGSSAQ